MTGGAAVTLADAPSARGGAWSEDGTIVFSPNQTPVRACCACRRPEGDAEPLTSLADGEVIQLWPQVLPGGKAVLYTSSSIAGAYNDANLVVQPLPSGDAKGGPVAGAITAGICRAAIWSTCTTGRSLRRPSISTGWR